MGKTLLGSLRTLANRAPVPYAPAGARTLGHMLLRPAGVEAQMRAMGSSGTLFAIVDRITTSYSQITWRLYRKAPSGLDADRVEVTSHAALDLWNRPNPFMTGPAFREAAQQHEELTGEQWWVTARNPRSSIPLELWPVRPDRMEPVPDADDFLAGYQYRGPSGEQIPLRLDEVIFLRRPNPLDPYRGMGPVQTILTDLDAARYSKEWNRNFFLNSAEPGGIIQVEKRLSDDEFDEARERWHEQHRGVANAHRVSIIENGLTWVDRKYTMKDMQFTELASVGREVIREAFGFPKPMLGAVDDVNRANADAAEVVFARWLMVPRCERTKAALNTVLLPLFGAAAKGLEFDYDSPVPADMEAEAAQLTARATAAKTLREAGWIPEDVLSVVGLPEMGYAAPAAPATPGLPAATARTAVSVFAASRDRLLGKADNDVAPVRAQLEEALTQLLDDWEPIAEAQHDALAEQIAAAVDDGDLAALAALTVDSHEAAEQLRVALGDMAQAAAAQMVAEAAAQGVTVTAPAPDAGLTALAPHFLRDYGAELVDIAVTTAALLAAGVAAQAGREALRQYLPGVDGRSIATSVKAFLTGLKNRFRRDQLGGALHRATNTGRIAVLDAAPVATYMATEINDINCCAPCSDIDGTVFASLDEARAVYGAGGYYACLGGSRCRGTITARWDAGGEG